MVWGMPPVVRGFRVDLKPCFKVHNVDVIQLNNTKLSQMIKS